MALKTEPLDTANVHLHAPRFSLARDLENAAHLLPAQGPITVFIHHNTLHAFEDQPFDVAVRRGGELFGCEPYLSEARYRTELVRGRIRFDDLRGVLADDLGAGATDPALGPASRLDLRLTMLQQPVWNGSAAELAFAMAETDALRRVGADVAPDAKVRLVSETRRWALRDLRGRTGPGVPAWSAELFAKFGADRVESWDDAEWEAFAVEALWRVCLAGIGGVPVPIAAAPSAHRPRELLVTLTDRDPDVPVNDVLVRFCAAYLDQGISPWPLPGRSGGLYRSFLQLYAGAGGPPDALLRGLPAECVRLLAAGTGPEDCVRESLERFGIADADVEPFLGATLLALRGWAGMIREIENRGDRVAHPIRPGSLLEYVAVRLLLDRLAASAVAAEELGYTGPLAGLRGYLLGRLPPPVPPSRDLRAYPLFQLAQRLGRSSEELSRLTQGEWVLLVRDVEGFSGVERRRVFHLAYETRFRNQVLDAVALHTQFSERPAAAPPRPRFQAVTCLDEREESFRRHLEEVAPDCETLGAAGFFGVAMYYRGAADAHFVPLCPIVLTPGHWVEERVCDGHEEAHRRAAQTRRVVGVAARRFQTGTRSAAAGAILTAGFGALAAVPLVARILFPRFAGQIKVRFGATVLPVPATRLKLERSDAKAAKTNGGLGYSVNEMATVSERLLRDIGMTVTFARLVFILGHGSDSLNNPHKSAYDCGACGGSPGAPNGRALAQMLNDPRVRAKIAASGIAIPADTWFLGGYHNTCNDAVTLADVESMPATHREELSRARSDFETTGDRNAHERSRRFMSARLDQTPAEARRHVLNRSEDLAQVRPELGHATNAVCFVGRRARVRGLFLDRRAFLASYDPTQDDAVGFTLARILGAAVPVCGGINLEYYFSHVDSKGYGAGTKLPHNVTGLFGVMDGAASDLRTGLPWQMVEIHEPVRLLFVVESTPAVVLGIMDRNPVIGSMVRNGWVQMTVVDPQSGAVRVYKDGVFHDYAPQAETLPVAATSADWYRGSRDHLEFAVIGRAQATSDLFGSGTT